MSNILFILGAPDPEMEAIALGTTYQTEVVAHNGAWEPLSDDAHHACAHCLEDGHRLMPGHLGVAHFVDGPAAALRYNSTLCYGAVWLCGEHIGECADEQGVDESVVIYGDEVVS